MERNNKIFSDCIEEMPFTIVLNQSNIVNTENNTLVYKFPNSVNFSNNEIAVQSVKLFYSWENINASPLGNNVFQYTWYGSAGASVVNVVIPNGLYEISQINSYLQFVMIQNGHYLINSSNQYVYFAEFILSPTKYAVQINTYPVPTSTGWTLNAGTGQYTGNAGTAYAGWTTPLANSQAGQAGWQGFYAQFYNPIITMVASSNFNKIIGYTNTFSTVLNLGTNTNLSYLSSTAPNVQPNSVAYISVTNIANPYANPSSILYSIAPDVAFGELISSTPPQFCWTSLLQGTYNQLRVQFLGNDFQPLTILDPVMTIMLSIRDKSEGFSGK
jgi:hypothetical protein